MGCTERNVLPPPYPILVDIPKGVLHSDCSKEYTGYFDLLNYRISNFYSISQQSALKLDDNAFVDHVVILTPRFNEGPNDLCIPEGESPQKLLVVFRAMNPDSFEVKIFDKVLSDLDWNLMFESVSARDHHFVIEGTFGPGNNLNFYYTTTVGCVDGEYYVENFEYEKSGRIQQADSMKYNHKEFRLEKYTRDFVYSFIEDSADPRSKGEVLQDEGKVIENELNTPAGKKLQVDNFHFGKLKVLDSKRIVKEKLGLPDSTRIVNLDLHNGLISEWYLHYVRIKKTSFCE